MLKIFKKTDPKKDLDNWQRWCDRAWEILEVAEISWAATRSPEELLWIFIGRVMVKMTERRIVEAKMRIIRQDARLFAKNKRPRMIGRI